jgi:polar amino acid transport system substrate-binding protein
MRTLSLLFISCMISSLQAAEDKPLIKFGYAEACPHMCPNDNKKGFTTDIARSIFESLGYEVKFYALPWARAAAQALSGELNGVLSAGKDETPLLLFPEIEIALQSDCFIGRKNDEWMPTGADSFVNRHTIVFRGWANEIAYRKAMGDKLYEELFDEFSIDENYMQRVVNMVKLNRAQAFWMDINVFNYYRTRHVALFADQFKNLGCIKFQNLYLAFSPAYPELSEKLMSEFDTGMALLRKSGELNGILQNYGLSDWR